MHTRDLFLVILFLFNCLVSVGQSQSGESKNRLLSFPPEVVKDTSRLECIYDYQVKDTILKSWYRSEMVLLHGKHYSAYMDYQTYRYDSILATVDKTKLTWGESNRLQKAHGIFTTTNSLFSIIRDNFTNTMQVFDKVMIDRFVYSDSVPDLKWALVDTTYEVCGYVCHKATTHFRGRDWIAWYCDVPVNAGPWKFSGLPGLILAVYDTSKSQCFIANTIRKGNSAIVMKDRKEFKTTRERFNKALREYNENPAEMFERAGLMPTVVNEEGDVNPPYRRLFFNSIELE